LLRCAHLSDVVYYT